MSVTIYHNPRCSKSRATLALLEANGITPNIRLYLEAIPSAEELTKLLAMLNMNNPRELMRKGEDAYKEGNLDDDQLTSDELITAMLTTPKLIERPIVVCRGQARIGRPPEQVLDIL
ncbi:MAG: arsenate reductase (glutaredoxin) [Gammaproteobacteria bacterium]|nr:arsenate reductase (glutaredoxin) [Gammaproteobacteria bacterium]